MKRNQPERTEQAEIVKLLRMLGASVYVLGTTRRKGDHPGTMQTPGLPDLWVYWPAKYDSVMPRGEMGMWIEVKAPKGKLSAVQKQFQIECVRADIKHLVGGLDAVIAWCQATGKLREQQ